MKLLAGSFFVLIAGCASAALSHDYTAADAAKGANLRSETSIILPILKSPCALPETDDIQNLYTALQSRYEALKASVSDQAFAMDFVITEADYDYQMSLVDIACPDPSNPSTKENAAQSLMIAEENLGRIENLVKAATVKEN